MQIGQNSGYNIGFCQNKERVTNSSLLGLVVILDS
jgi:hypothetical protein